MNMPQDDVEAQWRDRVRALLAAEPPESFAREHNDLGYGFGAFSRAFLHRLGELGWIDRAWPVAAGGGGEPPRARYALLHELAYGRAPAEALFYTLAVAHCIYTHGSEALQRDLLPIMAKGEVTFAEAFTEPESGSDLLSLRTSAEDCGDYFKLSGQKIWTSNGHLADYALVAARTNPAARRHRGVSMFIVDLRSAGVERRGISDVTGEASFSEIFFDGVSVPSHHLVGARDGALQVILDALEWDRLWARCVKAPYLRRELEDLVAYAKRDAGGVPPPWTRESIRSALADLAVRIEVCDALFEQALSSLERHGRSMVAEVSMAKMFADELGQSFYRTAVDVLGSRASLDARDDQAPLGGRIANGSLTAHGLMLAGGTPEMQRSTIATRALGFPTS